MSLVDLRQQCVGRVTEHRGSETGNHTASEVDSELTGCRLLVLVHTLVDGLVHPLVDGKLTDRIRNLFKQDRDEPGVQAANALGASELGEARNETGRVLPLAVSNRSRTFGSDTRRIRVASRGVNRMSAKNLM